MNKFFRSLIGILLAAVLCIGMCSAAFADDAESDVSLEDLMSLLTALAGDSGDSADDTGEPAADAVEFSEYSYGDASVAFPSSWVVEENTTDGGLTATSPDFTKMASFMLIDTGDDQIDLTDQDNIDMLLESMGGEDQLDQIDYIEICGSLGLWIRASFEEMGLTVSSYCAIAQFDAGVVYLTVASLGGTTEENEELFATIVNSIGVNGVNGATDFSNVYSGSLINYTLVDGAAFDASGTGTDTISDTGKKDSASQELDAAFDGELVLIDDDICTVKIIKIITDDDYYPLKLKMFAENKTDLNLVFSMDYVSINGYMVSGWWYEDVSAGHKSNSEVTFYTSDFEDNGITQIRDIQFTVTAEDYDDWSADALENEEFTLYPFGKDVPEQAPQQFSDDALVLVDNDEVTMIIKGFSTDDYYFKAAVYIENKTDKNMSFGVSGSTAVNGYEINPYFSKRLSPGKKMNTYITWFNSDLEENYIEEIEDIELDVTIKDYDDWYADPVYADKTYITFD